jgi:hypothetical protein
LRNLPNVDVRTDYAKLVGGLDLVSPALSVRPGFALDAVNYEPGVFGGYKRIDGYERFDGRTSPSTGTYYYTTYTPTTTAPAVGDTLTQGAVTAVVAYVADGALALTKVAGGTLASGAYTGSGGGTFGMTPLARGFADGYTDAVALNAAADIYRADIAAVPGSGSVLGAWMYDGTVYAFRNNAGATAAVMHKSTASGWSAVSLGRELAFTSGGATEIVEGNTITGATSGATAVITRVVRQSGSWAAGNAAGRFIFASQTGTFQAEDLNVGATLNLATIAGNSSAITLLPSGRYEFVNHNFTGHTDTFRMYGCDGVNRAFEFDGTVFVPIATGMVEDKPSYIAAHKKKLFLSFRGSLQNSSDGDPYEWSAITGASEIGAGEDITGLLVQPGEVLAIFTRNSIKQLLGSTIDNFDLQELAPEVGAIGHTVQNIGVAYCFDDRGINQITRTQAYGNFNHGTVSRLAQPVIDSLRSKVVASTVYRARNQYRLYANDGTGVIMTVEGSKIVGITKLEYPVNVTCACNGEDATGKDVVFFGDDDGFVYQADKGSSFDGEEIEAYIRPVFNHSGSPRIRKRYRKAVLEMSAEAYSSIRVQPEFTYGDADAASHITQTETIQGAGGYWDVDNWESFFYDARVVAAPEFSIAGTGTNLSLIFYSKSDIDLGHTLQGVLLQFTPRRLSR